MKAESFFDNRPVLLDIETTGLKADYGLVLVIGVRPYPGKPSDTRQFIINRRIKNWESAEFRMLAEFRRYMDEHPFIITYNGSRFDIPYLQVRLAAQGLPLLPKLYHMDLFYTVKRTFNYTITSRRSKYVQAVFAVGDPRAPHKDGSEMMTWLRATFARDAAAFARIVDHNRNECLRALDYQVRRLNRLVPNTIPRR